MPRHSKTHSRKSAQTTIALKKQPTFSSAAAVSVNRFGQTTFTSVRRQDRENGNGNFVPLNKASIISDDLVNQKKNEPQVSSEPKPKVYKFFKSRASTLANTEATSNKTSNFSSPKPLVINNFTKQDGMKRISTANQSVSFVNKSKNDTGSTLMNQPTIISKSVNLAENKSCEIKICGDKTIKTFISPTKKTHFIITNNSSNVRNATIKPAISPATHILPTSRGLRTSKRLKGINPENASSKPTTTICVVYDKDDDIYKKSDRDVDDEDDGETNNDNNNHSKDNNQTVDQDPLILNETNAEEESGPSKDIISSEEPETVHEEDKVDSDVQTNKLEVDDESSCSTHLLIDEKEEASKEDNDRKLETSGQPSQTTIPVNEEVNAKEVEEQGKLVATSQDETSNNDKKEDNIPAVDTSKYTYIKPKKKFFSNRERNQVEFNTKSFFVSSDMKDEFDIEMEKSSSQSSTTEKKPYDNDDDDAYVRLKRVKKAHQCHDLGETAQFDEDIRYYLSGIVSSNANSMRCLSILGLSQQAMRPEFRMHLRAHDDMPRIIKALMDAPQDSNLALCAATLMFVYNQDRLTMDIDPNALSLMLELLETRSDECNKVEEKHRVKVVALVEEMKNKDHAQYLKLTEITAGKLAMETLLGLTSKRAGDWFKVELRRLKGIDFIVNTVLRCAESYLEEGQMVKIDRCMHVLENVTFNNIENQQYIIDYDGSKFISTCIDLLKKCKNKIILSNDCKVFLSAFFSVLRVLTNLTSESVNGCEAIGTIEGIIELLLESLFELPSFIMSDQRFDLMVIILCLCINLAEFCKHIRDIIINSEVFMTKLTELLFRKIEEAAQVEQQTDNLLESHETVQMTEAMQDNLLMQMISKSGTHMEHSLLSACVCLMFGCCIQDNEPYMQIVKNNLPNHSFEPLIEQLEKLRDFAHLADIMTQKGKERVQKVLQIFKLYK